MAIVLRIAWSTIAFWAGRQRMHSRPRSFFCVDCLACGGEQWDSGSDRVDNGEVMSSNWCRRNQRKSVGLLKCVNETRWSGPAEKMFTSGAGVTVATVIARTRIVSVVVVQDTQGRQVSVPDFQCLPRVSVENERETTTKLGMRLVLADVTSKEGKGRKRRAKNTDRGRQSCG